VPVDTNNVWVQFGIHVVVGTLAGGLSDAVAVRMLFRPRRRFWIFQGAIPKNKERLARSIGRTVGERLLTPADVLGELTHAGVREMFDANLAGFVTRLLDTERGSLREQLPPPLLAEVERAIDQAAPLLAGQLSRFAESPEFEDRARRFVARTRAELADQPVGRVLTPARRAELRARAEAWSEDFAHSEELEQTVRGYLAHRGTEFLTSTDPLLEKVPPAVVRAIEGAIDSYLPLAVGKLGTFLQQPASRARIRDALTDLFHRFVEDLRFHERIIAKLMVTERTFDTAIDALKSDGVEQLAALLEDPVVRDEVTRSVHDAVITYLRKPAGELVGGASSERAEALMQVAGDYLLAVIRAERTRTFLIGKLNDVLERSEGRTWGELLGAVSDETFARWIVQAARSPRTAELAEGAARTALLRMLDKPLGRPGRWLPADAAPRLASVLSPAIWEWVVGELPMFIERLNVQAVVEQKVMNFSTERVEEIIRGVMQRELNFIVKCGFVLGGLIGVVTFTLTEVFGILR